MLDVAPNLSRVAQKKHVLFASYQDAAQRLCTTAATDMSGAAGKRWLVYVRARASHRVMHG